MTSPIVLFFPREPVPEWLEKVEVLHTKGNKEVPEIIFGSPVLCIHYKGKFYLWAPLSNYFLKCIIKIDGKGHDLKVIGGGGGVNSYLSIYTLYRAIRSVSKGRPK